MYKVLNLGAGKFLPMVDEELIQQLKLLVINIDQGYYKNFTPSEIEQNIAAFEQASDEFTKKIYCNEDAFTFMERTIFTYNRISIYRFLEHIPLEKLLYFIYLMSTCLETNGIVDVIVPNYKILANMILNEDVTDSQFPAHDILLTTELLNEPSCPHASIWTIERAKYYFGLENRFEIIEHDERFHFDGRDIYLHFKAKKIKR